MLRVDDRWRSAGCASGNWKLTRRGRRSPAPLGRRRGRTTPRSVWPRLQRARAAARLRRRAWPTVTEPSAEFRGGHDVRCRACWCLTTPFLIALAITELWRRASRLVTAPLPMLPGGDRVGAELAGDRPTPARACAGHGALARASRRSRRRASAAWCRRCSSAGRRRRRRRRGRRTAPDRGDHVRVGELLANAGDHLGLLSVVASHSGAWVEALRLIGHTSPQHGAG